MLMRLVRFEGQDECYVRIDGTAADVSLRTIFSPGDGRRVFVGNTHLPTRSDVTGRDVVDAAEQPRSISAERIVMVRQSARALRDKNMRRY